MDLWESLRLLARRWYVVVPLLAATVFAAMQQSERVAPEYKTSGSLLLISPAERAQTGTEGLSNPYLSLSSQLGTVAVVAAEVASAAPARDGIAEQGFYSRYTVSADRRTPVVRVEVRGADPAKVSSTASAVLAWIGDDLRLRQERGGAQAGELITTDVLVAPEVPQADYSGRTRIRMVIAGLGFVVAVGVAFLVEGLAVLRRRRLRRTAEVGSAGPGLPQTLDGAPDRQEGPDQVAPVPVSARPATPPPPDHTPPAPTKRSRPVGKSAEEVTDEISSPEVGQAVSAGVTAPEARAELLDRQRKRAEASNGGAEEDKSVSPEVVPRRPASHPPGDGDPVSPIRE